MQDSIVMFTFSVFNWRYPFRENLIQKNQNCQFKLKFGTETNSNMQNSLVVSTFSVLDRKDPFWSWFFFQKNQNCQFKMKIGTKTNSNMQNSMALFIFSVLKWKHPFWANLVKKIKFVFVSWNLVPRLIQICRI